MLKVNAGSVNRFWHFFLNLKAIALFNVAGLEFIDFSFLIKYLWILNLIIKICFILALFKSFFYLILAYLELLLFIFDFFTLTSFAILQFLCSVYIFYIKEQLSSLMPFYFRIRVDWEIQDINNWFKDVGVDGLRQNFVHSVADSLGHVLFFGVSGASHYDWLENIEVVQVLSYIHCWLVAVHDRHVTIH